MLVKIIIISILERLQTISLEPIYAKNCLLMRMLTVKSTKVAMNIVNQADRNSAYKHPMVVYTEAPDHNRNIDVIFKVRYKQSSWMIDHCML